VILKGKSANSSSGFQLWVNLFFTDSPLPTFVSRN